MKYPLVIQFLVASIVLSCSFTAAQDSPTDKGSIMVTGGGAFISAGGDLWESTEGDRLTSIQFATSFSTFIVPGLAPGGKLLLNQSVQGGDREITWSIGPHLMYFIGGDRSPEKVKGAILRYVGVSYLYGKHHYHWEWDGYTNESSLTETNLSFGGGVMQMLTQKAAFYVETVYQLDMLEDDEGELKDGNKFIMVLGLAVFLY